MKTVDRLFAQLLYDIIVGGDSITTRNSTVTRKTNMMVTFDSTPLIGIRKTAWKSALREFEWFMSGSSDINDLHESVHSWWKPWADDRGIIQNNYSKQFRSFEGGSSEMDQVQYMIDTLKNHPNSRRNVITTWNTTEMTMEDTPITNCHGSMIQAFVDSDDQVHLTMYQRSADMVLGVQHNLIQYWAFLMWIAHRSGRKVGSFTWIGGDCHIYPDHHDMVNKIINHKDLDSIETPQLVYTPTSGDFKAEDFTLDGEYNPVFTERLKMTV